MRIVALEEHVNFPELTSRIPEEMITVRGWPAPANPHSFLKQVESQLVEVGKERLGKMDEAGITVQVLSISGAGADLLDAQAGPALARDYNDALVQKIAAHPDRFAGFAHLPMTAPEAAADELKRTVTLIGF